MAFKNVQNLLLINHNDGFIDDDEFNVLYDLFASKNSTFRMIRTRDLTWKSSMSPRVLQSFALENEIYKFWHDYLTWLLVVSALFVMD